MNAHLDGLHSYTRLLITKMQNPQALREWSGTSEFKSVESRDAGAATVGHGGISTSLELLERILKASDFYVSLLSTYMYVYFFVNGNISIYMYTYLCVCIVELIGSWFQGLCWVEVLAPWLGVKSRADYSYESQFRSWYGTCPPTLDWRVGGGRYPEHKILDVAA